MATTKRTSGCEKESCDYPNRESSPERKTRKGPINASWRTNAFEMLMSGNKKPTEKRRLNETKSRILFSSTKRKRPYDANTNIGTKGEDSRFVVCPAGCGRHVLELHINAHLDRCCAKPDDASSTPKMNDTPHPTPEKEISPKAVVDHFTCSSSNLQSSSCTQGVYGTCSLSAECHYPPPPQDGTNPIDTASQGQDEEEGPDDEFQVENARSGESNSFETTGAQTQRSRPTATDMEGNAFTYMMKQSQHVFSDRSALGPPIRQWFHLHEDGSLTWTDLDDDSVVHRDAADDEKVQIVAQHHEGDEKKMCTVRWSSKVTIKPTKSRNRDINGDTSSCLLQNQRMLELTVSSSIPSCAQSTDSSQFGTVFPTRRLIRRHSRLSVPVLKSILQKSIRRRRPLPSVRVAMELADKSFGDLVRRLPIMILEDSALHPDFPFLVWLMVADSKDFIPPAHLVGRVMQVVFEVAACPWKDDPHQNIRVAGNDESDGISADESHNPDSELKRISLTSDPCIFKDEFQGVPFQCELIVRSILLRVQYGGMACDMTMLHDFALLWRTRFQRGSAPMEAVQKISMDDAESPSDTNEQAPSMPAYTWCDVMDKLCQKARKQSSDLVFSLVETKGLDRLMMSDVCPAGVDFHCSSILDTLLSDEELFLTLCKRLRDVTHRDGSSLPQEKGEECRSWILGVLKSCMWNYSSGCNYRNPLLSEGDQTEKTAVDSGPKTQDVILRKLWDEILLTPVADFAKRYVEMRLAAR